MNSLLDSSHSLMKMFDGKLQEFADYVDSTHMVWLEEIQQEANRMFSSDFNAEPELMPKTPSQKKRSRRKRISVGHNESRTTRFSKGKRSNLRTSSGQALKNISEVMVDLGAKPLPEETAALQLPKRTTRLSSSRQRQTSASGAEDPPRFSFHKPPPIPSLELTEDGGDGLRTDSPGRAQACPEARDPESASRQETPASEPTGSAPRPQSALPDAAPGKSVAVVRISAAERLSAEILQGASSHCRVAVETAAVETAAEETPAEETPAVETVAVETAAVAQSTHRSSVQRSLRLRRSLAGLRRSITQESVRRASRRSFLKKKARMSRSSSTCSSHSGVCVEMEDEKAEEEMTDVPEHAAESEPDLVEEGVGDNMASGPTDHEGVQRVTRSMAQTVPPPQHGTKKSSTSSTASLELDDGGKKRVETPPSLRPRTSAKRRAAEAAEDVPVQRKKSTPPLRTQSAVRPNMRSFLHTVQKNQLLMMTPGSLSRNTVVKSFIKHTTPLRVDLKQSGGLVERERLRLESFQKKQEQEMERKKKLEEEKRKKQEELKRKRDERLRKVVEARLKEEQKEEEKNKKIAEKNEKLRAERLAEEKAKKKVASKRQEELELKKRQEEEARKRKILQAEEEKKQQELLRKRRAEAEQEARRAQELEREREREREQEQQRELLRKQQAAALRAQAEREKAQAEREKAQAEREKAQTLQRELEKAAREKERREAEERKRNEEIQRQLEEKRAAPVAAPAKTVVTVEIQKTILKAPMGQAGGLNLTMDVETPVKSAGKAAGINQTMDVESYELTPKGGDKPRTLSTNPEDYGMDQNSDDSTDDESAPRKPIPSWAEGRPLQQAMLSQYYNPVDLDSYFGDIEDPKLEKIFNKSKPRYFKRTSSAVWQSPPQAMGRVPY